jgi:thiaminase
MSRNETKDSVLAATLIDNETTQDFVSQHRADGRPRLMMELQNEERGMHLDRLKVAVVSLVAIFSGAVGLLAQAADLPKGVPCDEAAQSPTAQQAKQLIAELRKELAGVEDQIRHHPYLTALEDKQVSLENLKAFAGEQYNIIRSDLRSDALLVARFGTTPSEPFFRGILEGEIQALDLLLDFAKALGLNENDLKQYEPRPGAQAYPAYATWLALYGSEAEVGAALRVNFPVFGENTGRMATALRSRYGLSAKATAFFDFFASPIPNFECDTLRAIESGLQQGVDPRLIKRAARLLQAYEKFFWDAVAGPK